VDNNNTVSFAPFEVNAEQVIFYGLDGRKMGVYCVTSSPDGFFQVITASEENVYYGGRLVAKRTGVHTAFSNGQVSDFTMDRLHSKGDGSKFYPYGESRAGVAGNDQEQFATYTRDAGTELDYADQRWYASGVGRFGTTDLKDSSFSLNAPLSANRYSYVLGDAVNMIDPNGLDSQWVDTLGVGIMCIVQGTSEGDRRLVLCQLAGVGRVGGPRPEELTKGDREKLDPKFFIDIVAYNNKHRKSVQDLLNTLTRECQDFLINALGVASMQSLRETSNNVYFWETNRDVESTFTFGSIDNRTLDPSGRLGGTSGSDAVAYVDPIGSLGFSPNIYLTSSFQRINPIAQQFTLLHELIHINTRRDDISLANRAAAALGATGRFGPGQGDAASVYFHQALLGKCN
jgi:RHS repeat-associated protein